MMKIYKRYYIAVFAVLLTVTSCEKDFLNRTPGIELDDQKVFSTPMLAARYADDAYNYLINEYVRFNSYRGSTSQASDEAVSGNSERTVTTLNKGTYHDHATSAGLNDIGDVWKRSYMGIAVTTKMLANIDKVPQADIFPARRVKGEMHFIRAFLYFELTKRFGGVPIIDKVYTVEDNVNLPRNTYDECLNFMLADIEAAISLLGTDYGPANYGRATIAAAQALKARVLLYAASKLNNPTGDKQKWKAAADAAKVLMDGRFSLQADYATILNVPESEEYIMIKVRGNRPIDGMFKDYSMSPAAGGQQGQMNPTQNHVDMYEMKETGKLPKEAGSGYDPQKPYDKRDPRFYANILYNGASWQGGKIETWYQPGSNNSINYGKDAGSDIKFTATSYYCKKYWPEVYKLNGGSQTILNYVFFRYAEILLNYAEAQNEYLDALNDDVSIYKAINDIRSRASVNMPPLPLGLNKDQMREKIRHERAIELAFEDHRWYDIMRWQIGVETIQTPMYGMSVKKNTDGTFTYNPTVLADNFQKLFGNHQHRYPIPKSEIQKSNGVLIQNEGWEN